MTYSEYYPLPRSVEDSMLQFSLITEAFQGLLKSLRTPASILKSSLNNIAEKPKSIFKSFNELKNDLKDFYNRYK